MGNKIHLDKITEEEAVDYANREADLNGFPRGSERWEKAVKDAVGFAFGTMSVGRNPRRSNPFNYETLVSLYPDVFSDSGFAGKIKKHFKAKSGESAPTLQTIQNRLLSAFGNLAKLFENGALNMKTTAKARSEGKIPNSEMSDFQFPNKEDFDSKEAYNSAVQKVVKQWFINDLITNVIIESLTPFFNLTETDVDQIMSAVTIEDGNIKELATTGRKEFVKRLRAQVRHEFQKINYRNMILGNKG